MCEYLGRTGYFTLILHCRQGGEYLLESLLKAKIREKSFSEIDF